MTFKDEAPRAVEERVAMRVRDQHPDAAQLSQGGEHPTDLRTVLKEVVEDLHVVLGRIESIEKLLTSEREEGSPQEGAPIGSQEEL